MYNIKLYKFFAVSCNKVSTLYTNRVKGGWVMQNIEEIYQNYAGIVYKYIFCLTGNEDISEEIVQETFWVAVKDINKFKRWM